ncbi:hypothetical protein An18g02670 [Aspergillus niger]|uniref:Uncharacterized protein n=2 Tax=Aspergillus niger TaxID=5061 RepID=A2RAC4_ASPNC|nr:hypothetical protein An18g02670 [Aspergillus niger]CAK48650.1 hypothetical protein An18g02670 [Aspergillus niger]
MLERGIVPVFPCAFGLPHNSGNGTRDGGGGGGGGSTYCIRLETSALPGWDERYCVSIGDEIGAESRQTASHTAQHSQEFTIVVCRLAAAPGY